MSENLKRVGTEHGDKIKILPIHRLTDVKNDLETFSQSESLNGFQKYILSDIYQTTLPEVDFTIQSIILVASPFPAYGKAVFHWQGEKVTLTSPARAYPGKLNPLESTKQYLTELCTPRGYHLHLAMKLPMKRLAVSSGLAKYGRNNICYVEGMGSFFALVAYLSDIPSVDSDWNEVSRMESCDGCTACLNNCPTGAILKDRFLINNERCLSSVNEMPGEFPEWVPVSAHHSLYDCFKCQNICPQNKPYMSNIIGPIEFNETETEMLLSGTPMEEFPEDMVGKVKILGLHTWIKAIPRNLRILLETKGQPQ